MWPEIIRDLIVALIILAIDKGIDWWRDRH